MTDKQSHTDCLIAVHLWDWPAPTNMRDPEELLDKFISERMCNAVCIWPDHQPGRFELPVEAIEKHDVAVVFYYYTENVYNWMQSRAWSGRQDRMREYVDHWTDAIYDLSARRPGRVWWSMGHEHFDQSIGHSSASDLENGVVRGKTFASKQEAADFYRQWVLTDAHKIHWANGHIRQAQQDRIYRYGIDPDIPPLKYALGCDIGIPSTIPYLAERGLDPNDLFFGAGGTVPASAAHLFSLGPQFKFFWWECSYVGTGLQPGIAMVRGAARQYGRKWLMDHSPYSSRTGGERYSGPTGRGLDDLGLNSRLMAVGVDDPTKQADLGLGTPDAVLKDVSEWHFWWPQHDKDGNRLSGLSSGMILRDWLWSYMSGADCIFQEAAACTHFIKVGDEQTGEIRVTPYGQAAKQLYAFAQDRCPDRGTPVTPIALLMDFNHGLDPTPDPKRGGVPFRNGGDVTWGSVPFTPGDHMADRFFSAAFPGHSTWPDRPKPWKTDEEFALLLRAGLDERPYERQTVVPGAWGDIFDVVLDNAEPRALDDYEAILVLGDITVSPAWLAALEKRVHAGARVMINAAHLPNGVWPAWLGCMPTGKTREATSYAWQGEEARQDRDLDVVGVRITAARVLAESSDGLPLVLANRFGEGEIWITTPAHIVPRDTQADRSLCAVGLDALERFLRPFDPVAVEGLPLAHIVNRRLSGDLLITLANPSPDQWTGRIRVPNAAWADERTRDIWNQRAVVHEPTGADLLIHLVIPPWGLSVIELKQSE